MTYFRLTFIALAFLITAALSSTAHASDPYTVTNIAVDAEGKNTLEAQSTAIKDGQMRGANAIINRMSLARERAAKGFPGVTAEDGAKLIRGLEIANEKRSAGRYIGDVTIAFNPAAVAAYLKAAGLTQVSTQSRTRLVIPIMSGHRLWGGNDWERAWTESAFGHALTPLQPITPRPGAASLIGGGQEISMGNLQQLGQLYGVQQILVARATPSYQGYSVSLRDVALDRGNSRALGPVSGISPDTAAFETLQTIEEDWKESAARVSTGTVVQMPVSVLYRSHQEWLNLREIINGTSQIRNAQITGVSKAGAVMTLSYGGDIERLRNELAYKGISLREEGGLGMTLSRARY